MSAPGNSDRVGLAEVLDRVARVIETWAEVALPPSVADAVQTLDGAQLEALRRVLEEVLDLEDRTVRNVLGRNGKVVPVHHFRACRAEDAETSWDHRPPFPPARVLRDALMGDLLGDGGPRVEGIDGLADAARAGKRFLFFSNHESVFDLAVLPRALEACGLGALSERLTFFVNPKIFNMPLVNLFICKPVGLIKVPQNPRIAANESVMEANEIRRRARHGFKVAGARLAAGDSLVIYPEGLRSDGLLHRFARAYLDLLLPESLEAHGLSSGDVLLAPWAHQGVRGLERLSAPGRGVTVRFGEPVAPEVFFDALEGHSPKVGAHLAAFLVARLLPEEQRGLYGDDPEAYLDHPHFRLRIQPHTLADIELAGALAEAL